MKVKNDKENSIIKGMLLAEASLIILLIVLTFTPLTKSVNALIGTPNATVTTSLSLGNVYPEILSIKINDNNPITLLPNSTVNVSVMVIIRDYNGDGTIRNVTGRFFQNTGSYDGTPDNNNHYRNWSCVTDTSYGNTEELTANCNFSVYYYANNATWNATINVVDNNSLIVNNSNLSYINTLLSVGLPSSIDYGVVNSTEVSQEKIANVTNFGNVLLNLSLSGYGGVVNDNLSMNCTLGNISVDYEKFNLTTGNSTLEPMNLTSLDEQYENLTSNVTTKKFGLHFRKNDTNEFFDSANATYWRIYVPVGAAGNCSGFIVFGATTANGD